MSSEDTSNNTMPLSTEAEHQHGGAGVVVDYQAFRLVYLASSDAEDAECDNNTPELMEARVRRVWANYDGDLDAAIALTDQQECAEGERCCGCERTLEGGDTCPICSEENLKVW